MYERINDTIITIIEIGNEVYDKVDNLGVEDRLTRLIKELVKSIKQKMGSSDDRFFKYAYENADVLHKIVQYHPVNEGGSHRNGIIYIGEKGFTSPDMGSDGDIKATIFHEYMHYINFKLNIYPKRYSDEVNGIVYSENISMGDKLESDKEFLDSSLNFFLLKKCNSEEYSKYESYPASYEELDENQKQEVQDYITAYHLEPQIVDNIYQYIPSNHHKDEINAHNKTIEASGLGIYTMSQAKLALYDKEIIRYTNHYDQCMQIENEKGYTPSGHQK